MSNERDFSVPGKGLDDHCSRVESLETEISPPYLLNITVRKFFSAYFSLCLHHFMVKLLQCFGVKGFQEKGIDRYVPIGDIARECPETFTPDARQLPPFSLRTAVTPVSRPHRAR